MIGSFLAALGVPQWPVRIEGRGGDRIELGAAAAAADLGWAPVWSLDQALRAAARWYEAGDAEQVGAVMDQTVGEYAEAASLVWGRDLVRS